eukprot:7642801-Heterocapsa_arctica.AAC.1
MGQAISQGSEAMKFAARQVVERNGLVKGTDGFKACLEMLGAFGEITQFQSRLLAQMGSAAEALPDPEAAAQAPGLAQEDPAEAAQAEAPAAHAFWGPALGEPPEGMGC